MVPTFEHRKFYRAEVILKVGYKTTREPLVQGIAFSKNISCTGVNIIMADELEKNTELELKIYVSAAGAPITARGRLLWQILCPSAPGDKRAYYSSGLQIYDMSSEDMIKASDFVTDITVKISSEQNRKIIEKLETFIK